jgi:hypothetical protein
MNSNSTQGHSAAQAHAELGGIQKHSIGALYPWAIVGRGLQGLFEVHNLQEGTVVTHRGAVWQGSAVGACAVADMAVDGSLWGSGFACGPAPLSAHAQAIKDNPASTEKPRLPVKERWNARCRLTDGRLRFTNCPDSKTGRLASGYDLRAACAADALREPHWAVGQFVDLVVD